MNLKRFTFLAVFSLSSSPVGAQNELWLKVGEIREFAAPRSAVIRAGSRSILRVVDGEKGVRVIGLKPGSSSLVIGEKSYSVQVSLSGQKNFLIAVRETVKTMMGLEVKTAGNRIEIGGKLLRFDDWLSIAELARQFDGEYIFRAKPLPDVAEQALKYLRTLIQGRGYPVIRFTSTPDFAAQLPQASGDLKSAVERLLKPFGITVETSHSSLALEPLVKTHVILAEVSRSFEQDFGLKWPSEYSAQILPSLPASADQNLMVILKTLEQNGKAQILASPNLLCRSGSEARFHAGGEFPIRLTGRQSSQVLWKPHGVVLKVKPRADFHGAMSLEIETEVSLLDTAHSVDGVPALKLNSVKSHFDLPGKRTIALSGLLRQEIGQSQEGLSFLTALPVLGPLFSSRNFRRHESDLVIFVTPEVNSPQSVLDEKIEMPEGWESNQ